MPSIDRRPTPATTVELYWLPLGAGGSVVRRNGRAYEVLVAAREHRPRRDLYHCALAVAVAGERFTIELTPAAAPPGSARGVVGEGPVGARWAGRFRLFRYELRCWRDGVIPDLHWAVHSPRLISRDAAAAQRILDLIPQVPLLVWGRDEARAGEMWNCNSVVAWLLQRAGLDADAVELPAGGRAPGWAAGLEVARRRSPADLRPRQAQMSAQMS